MAVSTGCGDEGRTSGHERTRAAYHEARLGELIEYITAAIDRYRAGEIDAYTVDETIHHYHRAARELWIFCWSRSEGTVCGPRGGVAGAGPWAPALVFLRDGACGLTVGRLPGGVAETPIARPTTCCRRHAPTFSGRSSS